MRFRGKADYRYLVDEPHGFARGTLDGNFGPGQPAIDYAVKVLLPAVSASAGAFSDDGA
ncbi:MAG: hypothetical protein WA851_20440 [Xanthobacteraceae bacterium]